MIKPARHAEFVLLLVLTAAGARAQGLVLTVDRCLPPNTAGLTASVHALFNQTCGPHLWSLSGGTITAGQGTNTITFTSGPSGSTLTFHVWAGLIMPQGNCRPATASAVAETYPVAEASGDATICPGLSTQLAGSGGSACEWAPAEGLDDSHSCTPIASPSTTTTYNLVVGSLCQSTNEASATVTVSPGADHVLSVDQCLPADTPDLVASISGAPGETYSWDVSGGTITSGQSSNTITFTSGPPGSSLKVSVDVSADGCGGFAERQAQLDFRDVPPDDIFHADICSIGRHGITAGCGNGDFCPDALVRRDQMAVFLLKAKHGSSYRPPACSGIFTDVACPGPFTDWVEQLDAEGITAGCGNGNYCPDRAVTRAQMSAMLLKTEHGSTYTPPSCAGVFGDVACADPFADWIEALYAERITAGCQASPLLYCPGAPVRREQMATFLAKTFGLQ